MFRHNPDLLLRLKAHHGGLAAQITLYNRRRIETEPGGPRVLALRVGTPKREATCLEDDGEEGRAGGDVVEEMVRRLDARILELEASVEEHIRKNAQLVRDKRRLDGKIEESSRQAAVDPEAEGPGRHLVHGQQHFADPSVRMQATVGLVEERGGILATRENQPETTKGTAAVARMRRVHMRTVCVMRPMLSGETDKAPLQWRAESRANDSNPKTIITIDRPSGKKSFAVDSLLHSGARSVAASSGSLARGLSSTPEKTLRVSTTGTGTSTETAANMGMRMDIAAEVRPVVRAAMRLDGSHNVVLAHGRSGAGKTTCLRFMVTEAAEAIFGGNEEATRAGGCSCLQVRMSLVQEHLGNLEDLLHCETAKPLRIPSLVRSDTPTAPGATTTTPTPSAHPEPPEATSFLSNAAIRTVTTAQALLDTYHEGCRRRTVRRTPSGAGSSRSHLCLTLVLSRRCVGGGGGGGGGDGAGNFSTLTFMDPGGHQAPERAAGGLARDEAVHINLGLSHLGTVLTAGSPLRVFFEGPRPRPAAAAAWAWASSGSSCPGMMEKKRPESCTWRRTPACATTTARTPCTPCTPTTSPGKSGKPASSATSARTRLSSHPPAPRPPPSASAPAQDLSSSMHVFRACALTHLLGFFLGMGEQHCPAAAKMFMVVLAVAPTEEAVNDSVNTLGLVAGGLD